MNVWHKRLMYLQILLLALMCFLKLYNDTISFVGLSVFILLEIGILEFQRKENKDAVFYRKSCLFAFADLLSVFIFLFYYAVVFKLVTFGMSNHTFVASLKYLSALLLYILIRKFYIIKNYSYEK